MSWALCRPASVYVLIDGAENFANGVSLRLGYQMHKGLDTHTRTHTHSHIWLSQPQQIARLLKNDCPRDTEKVMAGAQFRCINICLGY